MKKVSKNLAIALSLAMGISAIAPLTADASRVDQDAYSVSTTSDAADVQDAAKSLQIPNADNIRENITLPETGANGTTITWKTDKPDVVSVTGTKKVPAGVVTRQDQDEEVVLTATVKKGSESEKKEITLTVKAKTEKKETTDYIFATFKGDGGIPQQQISISLSQDGNHWMDMNDNEAVLSVANATQGDKGVRDPFLIRSPEGDKFYMIATDLCIGSGEGTHDWGAAQDPNRSSKYIRIWESYDLVNWSEPWLGKVGVEGSGFTWAPEAIWDEESQQYMVYWAAGGTTDPNHSESGKQPRTWYSMTRDFRTFTEPKLYCSSLSQPDAGQIDSTILYLGDNTYVRSSSSTPAIPIEISENGLFGDWKRVSTLESLGFGYGAGGSSAPVIVEGPELFRYNDDDVEKDEEGNPIETWGIIVDNYGGKGYFPVATTDFTNTIPKGQEGSAWSEPEYDFNSLKRHGTILPITADEYDAVMEKWGKTAEVNTEKRQKEPIAEYDFEKENNLALNGSAKVVKDSETDSNVLYLDGSDNGYAAFPQGFFDGRNTMTISMDIKTATADGNFFTFALGRNSTKYMFLRTREKEFRTAITKGSWSYEEEVRKDFNTSVLNKWVNVTLVFTDKEMSMYIDKELAGTDRIYTPISYLGENLSAYLGKSFYADKYFKGSFDNIKIYNRALSAGEIAGKFEEADKEELKKAIDAAVSVEDKDKYTAETWEAYEAALHKANEILADELVTQEEVDASAKDLKETQAALKKAVKAADDFTDVNESDWFVDYVQFVYERGIMTGLSKTVFGSGENLGRGQFATILYRMENEPEVRYTETFPDVPKGEFYTNAVLWASSEDIIKGYAEGTFGPADNITREQMAVMMYRYAAYKGFDVSASAELDFPDAESVSPFAEKEMKWAVAAGLISGNQDGTLAPQGNVSRAVCATIIQRFIEKVK